MSGRRYTARMTATGSLARLKITLDDVDLPLADRQRVEEDPDAWVNELTDDEFSDVLGPSWAELTGRHVEDLQIEFTTDEPNRPAA